jgi:hypothetical protein
VRRRILLVVEARTENRILGSITRSPPGDVIKDTEVRELDEYVQISENRGEDDHTLLISLVCHLRCALANSSPFWKTLPNLGVRTRPVARPGVATASAGV